MTNRNQAIGIPCAGPISRRTALQLGGGVLGGVGLARLLEARALSAAHATAVADTSVILIWLPGGPPHMEMYDLKPEAPVEFRGEFRPVHTNVPGLDVCELLPMHAKCADKFNLIRSCHHGFANHGNGHKRFLTGRIPTGPDGFKNDAPMVGSIVSKVFQERPNRNGLPSYIVTGDGRVKYVDTFSFGSAYLGMETHPFRITGNPNADNFQVENLTVAEGLTEDRIDQRGKLLGSLDRLCRKVDAGGLMRGMDSFNQRALAMLTSPAARKAFDVSAESEQVRERYGRHEWGQRALLARRLVEAGVTWVTVVLENPFVSGISMPKYGTYNWDSHPVNAHIFNDAKMRLPVYDRVVTALIEDLHARSLNRKVMLIVAGEFGRTPRISSKKGSQSGIEQPGRDHWPNSMSILVSGGGMRTGQVIGATNALGEEPVQRPLSPNDLWASVYQHLGIDTEIAFPNFNSRPMPILPFGSPISELDPVS